MKQILQFTTFIHRTSWFKSVKLVMIPSHLIFILTCQLLLMCLSMSLKDEQFMPSP